MGHTCCMRKRGSDFMGKVVYVLYSVIPIHQKNAALVKRLAAT